MAKKDEYVKKAITAWKEASNEAISIVEERAELIGGDNKFKIMV